MSLQRDLEMFRGDSKVLEGQVTNPVDGEPIDLTGVSMWMTVKKNKTDIDPGLFQKTIGDGILISDALEGRFKVEIEPDDTDTLLGKFYWDLQMKNTLSQVFTLVDGTLKVVMDVTKAT